MPSSITLSLSSKGLFPTVWKLPRGYSPFSSVLRHRWLGWASQTDVHCFSSCLSSGCAVGWRVPFSVVPSELGTSPCLGSFPFQGLTVFLRLLFFSILDYLFHSISASAYNRPQLNPCLSYLVFLAEVHYYFSDAKLGCTVAFQVPVGSPYSF